VLHVDGAVLAPIAEVRGDAQRQPFNRLFEVLLLVSFLAMAAPFLVRWMGGARRDSKRTAFLLAARVYMSI
jgi:hypothetical protein